MSSRSSLSTQDKKVRYRQLLIDVSTLEDEPNYLKRMKVMTITVEEAHGLMEQNKNNEQYKCSGEYYLDSRVLRATSGLAVGCSQSISSNVNVYDKHDLARYIKDNPSAFNVSFPREVPPAGYLFGAHVAPPPPRVRVQRPRAKPQQLAALTAPKTLQKLDKTEEGTELVTKMRRYITKTYKDNDREPLSYFHLVIDPDSFTATVENVYRLSFLARDGDIAMFIDENTRLPMVKPVREREKESMAQNDANQFIVSLDMKLWRDLIEAFNITTPMMTRD